MRHSQAAVAAVLIALASTAAAHAEPRVLVLDPASSKVSFVLEATGHDVEGMLSLKSGRIVFDPATGAASGEIAVDLTKAETGNASRDKTMQKEVLETAAYPLAVFRAERLEGTVAPAGASKVNLDGVLSFHGAEHRMKVPATIDVQNGHLKAETSFPIPYVEWGLHDPSILMLRVAKVVSVKVMAEGDLQANVEGTEGTAGTGER